MTNDDPHLADLVEFLKFPSVSTESSHTEDVRACANWIVEKMKSIGLSADLHETARHPVVLGRNQHKEGRPTVMIYGHYDVQPADPVELWDSPPFEPRIEDGKIFARGSTDNKGQILSHILGVGETIAEHGDVPVNLIMLVEGEEEIGSPNLESFLEAHKDELKCDVVAVSDTGMIAPGVGTFTYGLRGITCVEVLVKGPSVDLHSGVFGGAVANPAAAVARIVASMHDDEGRVAVEGFYDDVKGLQDWEREAWSKLPSSEAETLKLTGSPELFGEPGFSDVERRWARPTAEVNGIGGGFQGEGSKTIIPKEAFVKFSFRLVPNQDPDKICELVQAHIEKHLPKGVTVEVDAGHSGSSYLVDPQAGFGKAAQEALRETFGGEPALIREGGSIPIIQTFKDVLGVETLLLGLALPDCQMHAPNENFYVENFAGGIKLNRNLLDRLAKT
ncbi:MAG: acetylornithine deacetylase/succinyl-diaminopimelate desuccinylase-like protein [Verrucomicrobiales bacterium]|jgi:acetylornithine deacetylase/succinyl-diaminopimelate desuccinylase-like protein